MDKVSLPKKAATLSFQYLYRNALAVLNAHWHLRHATYLGKKVRVYGHPAITNWGRMIIGDRLQLVSNVARTELAVLENATLEIGERVFINYGCSIAAARFVHIGSFCSIGTYVNILDTNFHRLEPEMRDQRPEPEPVFLEDNVWLGARVIVLPGVRIGTGSAIGAGSVVTKDIPPRSLAVGMPARVIRTL